MHTTMSSSADLFDEVRWERMFPDQLERRYADWPVLYQTYGLCEPHGPHNALGLDALKAMASPAWRRAATAASSLPPTMVTSTRSATTPLGQPEPSARSSAIG